MADANVSFHCPEERQPRTDNNQLHSPLLRLPAELRNKIYIYAFKGALAKADTRHLWMFQPPNEPENRDTHRAPRGDGLINTCRQTRHESGDLFYSHCNFDFHNALFFAKYVAEPKFAGGLGRYAGVQSLRINMLTALRWYKLLGEWAWEHGKNVAFAPTFIDIFPVLEHCYVECSKAYPHENWEEVKDAIKTVLGKSTVEVHLE